MKKLVTKASQTPTARKADKLPGEQRAMSLMRRPKNVVMQGIRLGLKAELVRINNASNMKKDNKQSYYDTAVPKEGKEDRKKVKKRTCSRV